MGPLSTFGELAGGGDMVPPAYAPGTQPSSHPMLSRELLDTACEPECRDLTSGWEHSSL